MNREQITQMAREAGFVVDEKAQQYQPNCIFHTHHMVDGLLDCFAALVAANVREAIVQLFEQHYRDRWTDTQIVETIRARINT